jgi:hypothetical protein
MLYNSFGRTDGRKCAAKESEQITEARHWLFAGR